MKYTKANLEALQTEVSSPSFERCKDLKPRTKKNPWYIMLYYCSTTLLVYNSRVIQDSNAIKFLWIIEVGGEGLRGRGQRPNPTPSRSQSISTVFLKKVTKHRLFLLRTTKRHAILFPLILSQVILSSITPKLENMGVGGGGGGEGGTSPLTLTLRKSIGRSLNARVEHKPTEMYSLVLV